MAGHTCWHCQVVVVYHSAHPPSSNVILKEGIGTESCGSLRRVLRAFALYAPSIGYCQSMNSIVALLVRLLRGNNGPVIK